MIDASKSPVPAWKRYATMALLAVLLLVAGYVVYTKELHKGSPTSKPVPVTTPVSTAPNPAPAAGTTSVTTIPGGIPISSRNPFQ